MHTNNMMPEAAAALALTSAMEYSIIDLKYFLLAMHMMIDGNSEEDGARIVVVSAMQDRVNALEEKRREIWQILRDSKCSRETTERLEA